MVKELNDSNFGAYIKRRMSLLERELFLYISANLSTMLKLPVEKPWGNFDLFEEVRDGDEGRSTSEVFGGGT